MRANRDNNIHAPHSLGLMNESRPHFSINNHGGCWCFVVSLTFIIFAHSSLHLRHARIRASLLPKLVGQLCAKNCALNIQMYHRLVRSLNEWRDFKWTSPTYTSIIYMQVSEPHKWKCTRKYQIQQITHNPRPRLIYNGQYNYHTKIVRKMYLMTPHMDYMRLIMELGYKRNYIKH